MKINTTTKILVVLLALGILLGVFASCGETAAPDVDTTESTVDNTVEEEPKEVKSIDIYFIAGQSNASGETKVKDKDAAYEFAPELEHGFDHVLFSGKVDLISYTWRKTTLGLGYKSDKTFMGPEAGLAKALSVYYNEETGKTAAIIKIAFGGTNLLDDTTGNNQKFGGNWVSPSYAEAKGLTYSGITGGLYRRFMDTAKKQLSKLPNGFNSFNIKGLYWMQGESDREDPEGYKEAFPYFINDLRSDLSDIVKEITGNGDDRGASNMPIFVGTISKTFNDATESAVNVKFINMQKTLPDVVENVHIVDNSNYDINVLKDGGSVVVGSNKYHWNQHDILEIGKNVGDAMLDYYGGNP